MHVRMYVANIPIVCNAQPTTFDHLTSTFNVALLPPINYLTKEKCCVECLLSLWFENIILSSPHHLSLAAVWRVALAQIHCTWLLSFPECSTAHTCINRHESPYTRGNRSTPARQPLPSRLCNNSKVQIGAGTRGRLTHECASSIEDIPQQNHGHDDAYQ